jgi:CHRD domain-containing protein
VRRILIVLTLASVLTAMLVVVGPPTAQSSDAPILTNLTVVHAHMTGEQEVPGPGDPDGFGGAAIILIQPDTICYALTAHRIEPATAAHIHFGPPGVAGPIVVPLLPPTSGVSRGCTTADADLVANIAANPSEYYVNVHNAAYPAGAIRGHLHR